MKSTARQFLGRMFQNDTQPIAWWGRLPVYATTLLVLLHCILFVFVSVSRPLGYAWLISECVFSSTSVLQQFHFWQLGTYAFISAPSLWFLVEMAMLYFFGLEIEKFLGRRVFLSLYGILLILPPLFLLLPALLGNASVLSGAGAIHFAIFVAFAAIMPNAQIFFSISAKWVAIVLFAFNSLILFSVLDWTALSALWLDTAATLFYLRHCGVRSLQFALPQEPATSGFPAQPPQKKAIKQVGSVPVIDIDPILEKISSQGLQSLTPTERRSLENARQALLEKEKSVSKS